MRKKPRRKARPLGKSHGPTGQRFGLNVTSYMVGDWCESPDGSGPSEAVAIQILTEVPELTFILRLRSPASVDEMTAALQRHKASVWPE